MNKAAVGLLSLCATLALTGCETGICLIDTGEMVVTRRAASGAFRERPVGFGSQGGGLMTLQRNAHDRYAFRTISPSGQVTKERELPLFSPAYAGSDLAFTPDGSLLAFVDYSSRRLVICETSDLSKNLVPADLYTFAHLGGNCFLAWLDNDALLVAPRQRGTGARLPVDVVHLAGKTVQRICDISEQWWNPQLSPSRRYFAFAETVEGTRLQRISAFDLKTGAQVCRFEPAGGQMGLDSIVWGGDTQLVYAVDNAIYSRPLGAADSALLAALPANTGACLYAIDSKHNIHYQRYDLRKEGPESLIVGWRVLNPSTREDRELFRAKLVDHVSVDPAQRLIAAEVVY